MISNSCQEARRRIKQRLQFSVSLGRLDEPLAKLWHEAFNHLDDQEMALLIERAGALSQRAASALTLRSLMENFYPFREMIICQTDDAFKKRMGMSELLDSTGWSPPDCDTCNPLL